MFIIIDFLFNLLELVVSLYYLAILPFIIIYFIISISRKKTINKRDSDFYNAISLKNLNLAQSICDFDINKEKNNQYIKMTMLFYNFKFKELLKNHQKNNNDKKYYIYKKYIYIAQLILFGEQDTKKYIENDKYGYVGIKDDMLELILYSYLYRNIEITKQYIEYYIKYNHNDADILFIYYIIKISKLNINKYFNLSQIEYFENILIYIKEG